MVRRWHTRSTRNNVVILEYIMRVRAATYPVKTTSLFPTRESNRYRCENITLSCNRLFGERDLGGDRFNTRTNGPISFVSFTAAVLARFNTTRPDRYGTGKINDKRFLSANRLGHLSTRLH